jgi:hypothetical protein
LRQHRHVSVARPRSAGEHLVCYEPQESGVSLSCAYSAAFHKKRLQFVEGHFDREAFGATECKNFLGYQAMFKHDQNQLEGRFPSVQVGMLLICISGLSAFYGEATSLYAEHWLTSALEARFERPHVDNWVAIRGVVVLGGQPARLREALRLMHDHRHLRLVMSGPGDDEMTILRNIDDTLRARTEIERAALSTCDSASARLIAPRPVDRWLLVTSSPGRSTRPMARLSTQSYTDRPRLLSASGLQRGVLAGALDAPPYRQAVRTLIPHPHCLAL